MRRRFLIYLLLFAAAFSWRLNVFLEKRDEAAAAEAPVGGAAAGKGAPGKDDRKPEGIAGRVGSFVVGREEVEKRLRVKLWELEHQAYLLRYEETLERLNRHLLEKEAVRTGKATEQILADGIERFYKKPSEQEIGEFYEKLKGRFGDRPRQEVLPAIVSHLEEQRRREAEEAFTAALREEAGAEVLIEPPPLARLDVGPDDDPAEGPADAPVTLIEFSDFECPHCRRGFETMKKLKKHYGKLLRVVFRDLPLPYHENARTAAEAAGCAGEAGKFWPYHDLLFTDQEHIDRPGLLAKAKKLGLDLAAFEKCLDDGRRGEEIDKDVADAMEAGIDGAPAFLVNGLLVNGAVPFDQMAEIIDGELSRKGVPLPPRKELGEER